VHLLFFHIIAKLVNSGGTNQSERERSIMGAVKIFGVAALGAALVVSGVANAQTVHRHARHPAAAGHQIVVHARESYLTAGPGADPGQYNGYALDSISATQYMPETDHTFVGLPGQNRLPNNFTVPGCCAP
jgi:hypothetical protein